MGENRPEKSRFLGGKRRVAAATSILALAVSNLAGCGSNDGRESILVGRGQTEEQRDNYIDVRGQGGYEDQLLLAWLVEHPGKRPSRLIPHFEDASAGYAVVSEAGDNSRINCERVGVYSDNALINPMNYGPPAHGEWMKEHADRDVVLDVPIPSKKAPGDMGYIICWEGR